MLTTAYSTAVGRIAADVITQIIDGHAPSRTYTTWCADGIYRDSVKVYFADLPQGWHPTIPGGAVRVALDMHPIRARHPAHEARVFFEPHAYDAGEAAADIAAAVLDLIGSAVELVG